MLEAHNYTSFFFTEWGRWGLAAQNISSNCSNIVQLLIMEMKCISMLKIITVE